ncbi:MAG: hypothetical protein JST00_29700 [Deltaproteobacteria bacterium]|nr:hypothetical protein [Deltaproteobacteria bacterium]
MSSSRETSKVRSPASTEACIDEVVESTATAVARHLGEDAAATLRMTERRHLQHEPRLDSDPDVSTERIPAMTVSELAKVSARIELETPSTLSAFEVPAPRLWSRAGLHEQATRRIAPRAEEGLEQPRSSAAAWLFGGMALVVGLAASAAFFMHARIEETRATAAPPPPPAAEHVPPTPIVVPTTTAAPTTTTTTPAASASAVAPRRRR